MGNDLKGLVSCNFYVLLCNNIVMSWVARLILRLDPVAGVKVWCQAYAPPRHKPDRRIFHEHLEMILHTFVRYCLFLNLFDYTHSGQITTVNHVSFYF